MSATPSWVTEETDRRLYETAYDTVVTAWGNGCAARLGPVIYRALLAQAVLDIIAEQANVPVIVISDASLRRLVLGAQAWIDSKVRR
jgi:hypothetical protein